MKTTLNTKITVKDLCAGFAYNALEGRGFLENLRFSPNASAIMFTPKKTKKSR